MTGPSADGPAWSAGPQQPEPPATTALPAAVAEEIRAAVHAEFTPVLHYVADALGRNSAFDELSNRLRAAERRLEARRERPLVAAIHHFLDRLRHLDFDPVVKRDLEAGLVRMLHEAGFEETGQLGEEYDPASHQVIDGRAVDGRARVTEIYTPGLSCHGEVVFRARVRVSAEPRPRHLDGAAGQGGAAAAAHSEE